MIGLMSLLSEGAVPGSVPALKGLIPASGEINVMAPFDFAQPLFGNVATLAVAGSETVADLKTLAKGLNPAVGFWDPLNLAEAEFWQQSNEATIGFLRHAEIKHGRVAMAGFVGYCVHANGIHFPWKVPGDELCAPGVSPPELWQNIPAEAKWQILLTIGLFEFYSEAAMAKSPGQGGHYMRGGKPGLFPAFNLPKGVKGQSGIGTLEDAEGGPLLPHPVPLNLYDPFGFNKNKSDEWKAQKLKTEINNGRLAMIGLMSLLSEGAVPGSVPLLKGVVPASGEINVMAPFDFAQPLFGNVATLAVQGRSAPVQMFSEGDIGVLPPLGVYDPLGLIETRDMRRYEIMEIKHGRAAMLGFLHVIAIEAGVRLPGYLSVSQDLKFSDVPAGCFASLEAVPTAGWLQIMVLTCMQEAGTGFASKPQTDDAEPGDIALDSWVRYDDPEVRTFKLNVERQNGRAAMLGITGCLIHELLGVDALYPTGGLGGAAPPPIIAALAVEGRSGSVQMFSEGDIGVLPPLGVYDPLGLIETRDMRRYEIMEIKHGRAAMLGFLHVIAIEAGVRLPGYL